MTDAINAARHLPRKSKLFDLIRCSMEMRFNQPNFSAQPKTLRVTSSAENIEAMMPMVSVMANPLTGPEPSQKRIATFRRVVRLESTIALNALR